MSAPTPARRAAFETVRRVFEEDAWADRALRAAAGRLGLEGRERAQAQALAYGAVQRRGTTDHFIARLADRPAERIDPPLRAALRLGLYELLYGSGEADHATVDQAVALAKGRGGRRRGAGLVNAVLRRAARERGELLGGLDDDDPAGAALAHSVPVWLAELWWDELGPDDARSLLAAINEPPERALRVNAARGDRDGALRRLAAAGVAAEPPDPRRPPAPAGSIVVTGGERGRIDELITAGELVAQSRASAMVVELLAPQPGERVLDLCAGPASRPVRSRRHSARAVRASSRSSATPAALASSVGCSTGSVPRRRGSRTLMRPSRAPPPDSTRCWSIRHARASARLPRAPMPAGVAGPSRSRQWRQRQSGSSIGR